jgi:hypothetical protein
MNWVMKIIPIVALAALAATPASARTKHVRHHTAHHVVPNAYAYGPADPAGPPQRPIYSGVDGRLIGRANDPNIRDAVRNDDYFNHR